MNAADIPTLAAQVLATLAPLEFEETLPQDGEQRELPEGLERGAPDVDRAGGVGAPERHLARRVWKLLQTPGPTATPAAALPTTPPMIAVSAPTSLASPFSPPRPTRQRRVSRPG